MRVLLQFLILSAFTVLFFVLPTSAGPINVGGMYNVSGTNFPTNFGPTAVTLDANTHLLAAGALQVQAEVEDVDADTQWLEFAFSTTDGSTIASNLNSYWDFTISGIPYSEPALLTAFYYYWTIDGSPVQNIQSFAGGVFFDGTGVNPRNPAEGPVFGAFANPPGPTFDPSLFSNPFNLLGTMVPGGIDPSLINGFHVGMQVISANPAVPEPTSMALFGLTAVGLLVAQRRRRGLKQVEKSTIA